jgi:hypothetical protein
MVDLAKRIANRLRVMTEIFEAAHGNRREFVQTDPIREKLGLTDEEMADACNYLEGEGLIEASQGLWGRPFPNSVTLTHWGIREVEQSQEHPEQPTEHFPSLVSVTQHFHGDVIGSPIQAGSPGATQIAAIGDLDLDGVRRFVEQYDDAEPSLDLEPESAAEAQADIATIRAQLNSPKPKPEIIRQSLQSVRAILEGATGSMAASGLLELLQHIHL